jgi:hypothetical protein
VWIETNKQTDMQRRIFLSLGTVGLLSLGLGVGGASAQAAPKIAVTDLAYTERVAQYFEAATLQARGQMQAGLYGASASHQVKATYVAGTYSYMEQRELGTFTNDIKGALLQGTFFRLVQGKGFDAGAPQPTKAEQALNQIQTGKMAKPVQQPQVRDIVARIKKGEFNGADYVLFGTLSQLDFTDQWTPLQGTSSATQQYGLNLLADFSLIHTKTFEIKAAFSAQGVGNDTKIHSTRADVLPPNRAKVMREVSQSLARDVYDQLAMQLGYADPHLARGVRPAYPPAQAPGGYPAGMQQPPAAPPEQVMIIR